MRKYLAIFLALIVCSSIGLSQVMSTETESSTVVSEDTVESYGQALEEITVPKFPYLGAAMVGLGTGSLWHAAMSAQVDVWGATGMWTGSLMLTAITSFELMETFSYLDFARWPDERKKEALPEFFKQLAKTGILLTAYFNYNPFTVFGRDFSTFDRAVATGLAVYGTKIMMDGVLGSYTDKLKSQVYDIYRRWIKK